MIGFALLNDILFIGLGLFGPEMPRMVEAAGRMGGGDTVVEVRAGPQGPLDYQWLNAAAGPGTDPRAVLASGRIDQLVMTEALPLEKRLVDNQTVEYATRFRDLALRGNPAAQTFLYEGWPVLTPGDHRDWRAAIAASAPVWQALVAAVNRQGGHGDAAPQMRLIPLAQGLAALDDEIAAGAVPGLDDMSQIFGDGQRLSGRGTYFAAMLIHAALGDADPLGLPVWLGRSRAATLDEAVTEPMAAALQRIAWRVVRSAQDAPEPGGRLMRDAVQLVNSTIQEDQPHLIWQDADASYLTGVQRPGVGFNLAGINDWMPSQPFLDVFKTARPWTGHLPGQWGGVDEAQLRADGHLDAHGWPLRMAPEITHMTTLILTGINPDMISASGRYVLRYKGQGSIQVEGRLARNVTHEDGWIAFDYLPGEGSVSIHVTRIDPADPLRDISVVRQDRLALADAGQIFNPDFLARLRGAELLRFMDWMSTNNSRLVTPDEIPDVADYVWSSARGVPPEVIVALANELDLDPWFTMPHLANDDFVRSYARRVRDNLEPGRRAWVEFSNEVWNWTFDQRQWADAEAEAAWGVPGAGMQYGAYRAAQVADIWAEEFAPSASARLVRVVSTFTGATGAEDEMLAAPAWKAADPEGWRPLAGHFDAYGVTGYFHAPFGDPDWLAGLRRRMAESRRLAEVEADRRGLAGAARDGYVRDHRFDDVIPRLLAELRGARLVGQREGSVQWVIDSLFRHHSRAAARLGLELVMYEGGNHVVAPPTEYDDEELTALLIALNYSPGMAPLYRQLVAGWQRYSDQPFNFFTAIEAPSQYGSWGALRYLDDDNPRWHAIAGPEE